MSVTSETTPVVLKHNQKVPFFISRNYAFLWGGQAISILGDLVFDTTLTLWIATDIAQGQSWAPLALGGAVLSTSLPTLLVGPMAGVFVDRWDKKRLMIRMDIIRAVCIALLLLLIVPLPFLSSGHASPAFQIGAVYVCIILTTICALFFTPARTSLIQAVVEEKDFEQASGLALLTQNLSRIIGPSLAAPTLFVFGIHWALLINSVSFLISAAAVRRVRIRAPEKTTKRTSQANFVREFREGLRFFYKSRLLMMVFLALAIVIIADTAEQTLGVFFLLGNLHVPAYLYGFVGTMGGAGGILGAVLATFAVKRMGSIRSFWIGIAGFGCILIVFSRMSLFVPALTLIFLAGFPIAAANVALGPMLLRSIPRDLLGRVNAVFSTCISVVSVLAVSLVSILASLLHAMHARLFFFQFGPYDTIFSVAGLITLCAGLGVALSVRSLPGAPSTQQSTQEEARSW
jgi:Na+/melibiose symporter-like transporter